MAFGGTLLLKGIVPEEHENEVSSFSPTGTNDLYPGIGVWGIELKLSGKLAGHVHSNQFPNIVRLKNAVLTWAKSKTWTVAPEPYHHGPEIPYLYATALDCNFNAEQKIPNTHQRWDGSSVR